MERHRLVWYTLRIYKNIPIYIANILAADNPNPNTAKLGARTSAGMVSIPHGKVFDIRLQWRLDERDGVSNYQPSKRRVTGLCEGKSPVTAEFPTQRVSNVENDVIMTNDFYGV